MKKNENIIKKVEQHQNKRGIRYATHEGELYKFLKWFYGLVFAYNFVFSIFYILVILVSRESPGFDKEESMKFFTIVALATGGLVLGLILTIINKTRWHGRFIGIAALATIAIALYIAVGNSQSNSAVEITRLWGMPFYYYWRHGIPAVVGVLILLWMTFIDISAKINYNKLYKRIEDELYRLFRSQTDDTSDENWQAFLKKSVAESKKGDDTQNAKGKKRSKKGKNKSEEANS